MRYRIDELTFRSNSLEEQIRTRKIFESLLARISDVKYVSEHEKEFVYRAMLMSRLDDGNPDSIPALDNSRFKFLYLIYFSDLTGGSIYHKPNGTEKRRVDWPEAQLDINYLIECAITWDKVVLKNNHPERLLQDCCTEARKELKKLDSLPETLNDPYSKGRFSYKYKRWSILLRSKYAYHVVQEILEANNGMFHALRLGNEQIDITEFSYAHIINGHFAQTTKVVDDGKTFHRELFEPRTFHVGIQDIFDQMSPFIDENFDFNHITFRLRERNYSMWTEMKERHVKGGGKTMFRRLQTFYPLESQEELNRVIKAKTLIEVGNELMFWR